MTTPVRSAEVPDPRVIAEEDASEYLRRLDINLADLLDAVRQGHEDAANHSSPFYPVNAAGLSRWMETVRVLRERLNASDEWSVKNPHNRPVMQRNSLRYEVAAHRGSASTGLPHEVPALTRPAGKKTVDSVNRFREDLVTPLIDLADLIPGNPDPRDPVAPPYGTWILLYHPAEDGIRCEFSLPSGMTSDGTVEGWLVRVMLGTVDRDADGVVLRLSDDQDGDDVYYGIE
ncbi:MAG: hypothetical protein LKG15_08660 [Corynebacterium provencense]|jgi:hypothetical protein|uniref:hypothetical protein n=1 Tax=Corynebacterium provencense TaxID=1737425 RepID=UPI002989ACD8|nr:hypothetical protein [Corynebacterium provencense]